MRGFAVLITTVNVAMFCALAVLVSAAQSRDDASIDASLSKAVVDAELQKLEGVAPGSYVQVSGSCAQQQSDFVAVTGQANYEANAVLEDGFPVVEAMQLSYRARVNAICGGYNPNCYDVEGLTIEGRKKIMPRV